MSFAAKVVFFLVGSQAIKLLVGNGGSALSVTKDSSAEVENADGGKTHSAHDLEKIDSSGPSSAMSLTMAAPESSAAEMMNLGV